MRVDRLAFESVRRTLTASEASELNDALCDPAAWMRAAEVYGIARFVKSGESGASAEASVEASTGASAERSAEASYQAFGSLIIKNPHVADWFSVFCPVPRGMTALRSALVSASPIEAFESGVAEILGPAPMTKRFTETQSADDRRLVAAAALCNGLIGFSRTDAILGFLGIRSQSLPLTQGVPRV